MPAILAQVPPGRHPAGALHLAAARERAAELERAREELARRAVVEERLRIARELHDVVAHSMSIIAVQSGVGAHVLDSQPEEARKALAAAEATSRQALVAMWAGGLLFAAYGLALALIGTRLVVRRDLT